MDKIIRCTIVTPEGATFRGQIEMAILPAEDGEWVILYEHAPTVLLLGEGALSFRLGSAKDDKTPQWKYFYIQGGVVEVKQRYVLNVDDKLAIDLDDQKISQDLQQLFAGAGKKLSENAQVEVVTKGEEWIINNTNNHQTYYGYKSTSDSSIAKESEVVILCNSAIEAIKLSIEELQEQLQQLIEKPCNTERERIELAQSIHLLKIKLATAEKAKTA